MSRRRALLLFFSFLLLCGLLWRGLSLDPRHGAADSPLIGRAAPEFSLPDLADPAATFSRADLLGAASLVNVWATWCPSCRAEHAVLMEIARAGDIPLYGINWKDDRAAAQRWLTTLGDPYRKNGFDGDNRAGLEWGVTGAPETYVVSPDGRICARYTGPLTTALVERHFRPLIETLNAGAGGCPTGSGASL